MLEAEAAYRTAEADRKSAIARLGSIGAASSGSGRGGSFGLMAPVSGTVVERNASPGQSVGPSVNLFTVADLSNVWITVDVYEGDLARVQRGAQASVTPTAFPNDRFAGRVTYAGGVVDPESRTFKVRVEVPNPGSRLRPGMFAQVRIPTVMVGADAAQIVIPEKAIQDLNGTTVVFVARGPDQYVARKVTVAGRPRDGAVTIAGGLTEGERIAVAGAFQLKSEMTKGTGGGD
jgi:RND family efflux transporter MFP subunit